MALPIIHINIDAKKTIKHILAKITSGRWIMVVAFTLTYCAVILGLTYAFIRAKISIEVLLGIWAGFTPMVVLINQWYFLRKRTEEENGKEIK